MANLPDIPITGWVSTVVAFTGYIVIQIFSARNKRQERKEPSFDEFVERIGGENKRLADENRKLREELTAQDRRIDDMYKELGEMRKSVQSMNSQLDRMRQRQDVMSYIINDIAAQNPEYRPNLAPWQMKVMEDFIPAAWTPNVAISLDGDGNPVEPPNSDSHKAT